MSWREYFSNNLDAIEKGRDEGLSKVIWHLANFIVEIENGGLIQYLSNESSSDFNVLKEIAVELDDDNLINFLSKVEGLFTDNLVPISKEERNDLLDDLIDEEDEELDELSTQAFDLVEYIEDRLSEEVAKLH